MNFQGGSGVLIGTPNVNVDLLTDLKARRFPVMQDVSIEFKGKNEGLYGQGIFALDLMDGKVEVTGKGKMIVPPPSLIGAFYFGADTAAGVNRAVQNELQAIGATVAPSNTTANVDLGVINVATGEYMEPITTGSPAAGQYKFTPYNATGPVDASYAFAAADVTSGFKVYLNYTWPDTTGETLAIVQQPMGSRPQQQMLLFNNYKGKLYSVTLNRVTLNGFSVPTKQEGHWISDFDFTACVDAAGTLGYIEADI
jgi:hypothetical protein